MRPAIQSRPAKRHDLETRPEHFEESLEAVVGSGKSLERLDTMELVDASARKDVAVLSPFPPLPSQTTLTAAIDRSCWMAGSP